MHAEALKRWYVPQIFAALPLLLQIGLILFLVGLADFLWQLNHSVTIPVLMAVGATLLFLFVTTVLPTFQVLTLLFLDGRRTQFPVLSVLINHLNLGQCASCLRPS